MKKLIPLVLFCVGSGSVAAQPAYTLQQLKDSALQHNAALRAARLSIDAAGHQRKEAFTKYFPSVSATGLWFNANKGMAQTEVNLTEVVPPELALSLAQSLPAEALMALASPVGISMLKNGTVAGITATQPVFAGGQIINGNQLARVGEEVSRLQLRLSEQEVEHQTEQYYWQLVSLMEKRRTLDAVDSLLNAINRDVDIAVKAGLAMRNDMLQVQLRQNDIASKRLKVENGISIVKMLLGQYAGLKSLTPSPSSLTPSPSPREEGSIYNFNIVMPVLYGQDAAKADESALQGQNYILPSPLGEGPGVRLESPGVTFLPEYQLLSKQVEARKLQKRMEVGKRLPTVAVGAGYNYHNLLDRDHSFAMIFATVSVPISDWWGGSHAISRSKIEYQKALDEQRDKSELLEIRTAKAYNDVIEAREQLTIACRSIEQSEENLRLNRDYYRAGTSRMADLLEAQLLYQQALDARTDAFADLQLKLLEYRQASGLQ